MAEVLCWQVGEVRITRVQELEAPNIRFVLPKATAESMSGTPWLRPFCSPEGEALASIHSLAIEVGEQRIVVDTCVGNDKERPIPGWNQLQTSYLSDLEAAGFPAERVDRVVCTHLHVDHVGWNTRWTGERWVPTFPNARYLLARKEWEHWQSHDEAGSEVVLADSVRPVFDAGLVDLVDGEHELDASIRLMPTPGHTPGHVSVQIRSRGEEAVITGDLMHHPVQCAHPDWWSSFDVDRDAAITTRRAFLERFADTPTLVIGSHFAGPTAGRLVRDGEVYRLDV